MDMQSLTVLPLWGAAEEDHSGLPWDLHLINATRRPQSSVAEVCFFLLFTGLNMNRRSLKKFCNKMNSRVAGIFLCTRIVYGVGITPSGGCWIFPKLTHAHAYGLSPVLSAIACSPKPGV